MVRHAVLMDADQHSPGLLVDQSHPVFQVRHLLLPQGDAVRGIDGLLSLPGQHGVPPQEQENIPQLSRDGQIDAALRHAVPGHRAAVLAAVTGIQHNTLPACSGHGRLGRRSGPQGSRSCRQQQRGPQHHISPPKQHDHLRTPLRHTVCAGGLIYTISHFSANGNTPVSHKARESYTGLSPQSGAVLMNHEGGIPLVHRKKQFNSGHLPAGAREFARQLRGIGVSVCSHAAAGPAPV